MNKICQLKLIQVEVTGEPVTILNNNAIENVI